MLAEVAGIPQIKLHFDVEAICNAYEKIKPIAKRLDVEAPVPRIAGFCYPHIASLGAKIVFPEDGEPKPFPIIKSPEEIDNLTEPKDYLNAPIIQERLRVCYEIKKRYPKSPNFIGHLFEGPITTAVLIMGSGFLTLPYDDPEKAHKLLNFSVKSALNYANTLCNYFGEPIQPGSKGLPDDFAGMFPPKIFKEFVAPYWEKIYQGNKATERYLHSELLRLEHLPFLKELNIEKFDPSADQYLNPELLSKYCPCKFTSRILPWEIRDLSEDELVELYKERAKFKPSCISFYLGCLKDEPKIKCLLKIARELKEK
ncbi:MAG TPA: uroporphyrinogen decarboxylase family protein [bacterium]|nr:uroporphyrinogen decarboxylase family protein [bacterium]